MIMYADEVTGSMKRMIGETERRREIQNRWNLENGIEPESIVKSVEEVLRQTAFADARGTAEEGVPETLPEAALGSPDREEIVARLEAEMFRAAESLEFELAASLRDRILDMRSEAADLARSPRLASARRPAPRRARRRR